MSGSGAESASNLQGLFASLRASSRPASVPSADNFDGASSTKPQPQSVNPTMSRHSTPGPAGSQSSANLLGLLKFGAPAASPQTITQEHSPVTSRPEIGRPNTAHVHGRGISGISASDLVASLKAGGSKSAAPAPQGAPPYSTTSTHQDSLLKLLNQTASSSDNLQKASYEDRAGSGASHDSMLQENPPPMRSKERSPSSSPAPYRFFGAGEKTASIPFQPEVVSNPSPQTGPIFTYVNPFEQLAASSPRNTKTRSSANSDVHKRKIKSPSPAAVHAASRRKLTPAGSEIMQSIETPEPKHQDDGPTQVEALMGIGAPSRDTETVAQALDEVGNQVSKQVDTVLAEAEAKHQEAQTNPEGSGNAEKSTLDVMEGKIHDAAVEVKVELDKDENKDILKEAMPASMAEVVKEVIDEAAQSKGADGWESAEGAAIAENPSKVSAGRTVKIHQFPLRPFVSIDLVQQTGPDLTVREDSIVNIARFKKDFDQADRTLVTATADFILYGMPKNGGVRVIHQDNGNSSLLFSKSNDRIFNVAISTTYPGNTMGTPQRVIATGVSGAVYWTTLGESDMALSESEMEKQAVVFPPAPAGADSTSSGQLKTRAKKSSRHPEFFAIGRSKSIQIVFPSHARNSEFFKEGSNLDTEKYFNDRSLKISIGKASKDFTFSEDDSTIVTLDKSGKLKLWDIRDLTTQENMSVSKLAGIEIKTPILTFPTAHSTEKSWPTSVLFVDKVRPYTKGIALRYIVVGMKQNHTLQLWDLCLGKAVQELNFPHEKETDAICSVTYHPGTGVMAVGHPTRNSIYFIHLSAPKYNLPSMTQAKFAQRLANKDSTLPKAEATAIMSGMREYSFASKGQLRSVELVPSSVEAAKAEDEDEDPTVFELYVMHSKGVTCLGIKREDLGWSKDGRPLHPVDAKEEGLIIVKDLREPIVPTSEATSTNGDSLVSSAHVNRAAKTAVKEPEKAEGMAGALTPATNPEKMDKKRTKNNGVGENGSRVTASSSSQVSHVKAVPQGPTTDAQHVVAKVKDVARPSMLKHISRDAPEVLPASTQDGPSRQVTNGEPISVGISGDFLDREMRKIEQGVSAEFNKVLGRELDTLYQRVASDKRVQEAAGAAKQEAILRLVSSQLSDNVEKSLSRIIMNSIQESVLPAISGVTESALEKLIPNVVVQELQRTLPATVKSALLEAISRTMKEPDVYQTITESVTKTVTGHLERECSTVLQKSIIPTFTNLSVNAAEKITGDIERRVRELFQEAESQRRDDGAKIEQLTKSVRVLSETVHQMAAAQSDFQREILRLQQKSAYESQGAVERDSPTPSESASMHVSPEQEELNTVSNLIQDGRFEEGTIMWLQSGQQQALFDQVFVRLNPSYLHQISALVVLSVGAALTASMETNVLGRLKWLETVFASINPAEPEIQAVARKVLEVLGQRLQAEYMRIAESEPEPYHAAALREIAVLSRKSRELMVSFPRTRD